MVTSANQYNRDLRLAMDDLAKMLTQREELEVQIARTKRRIALLTELTDESGTVQTPDLDLGGLTEACKTALRGSRLVWMNIAGITKGLKELGFPLEKYKAPVASITTTVNRLVDSGQVESFTNDMGEKAYRIKPLGLSELRRIAKERKP